MRFRLFAVPTIPRFTCRHRAIGVAVTVFAISVACASGAATLEPIPTASPASTPTALPAPTPTFAAGPTPRVTSRPVDPEPVPAPIEAFAVLEEILEELGPRESATDQELAAARYLQSRLRELGYSTELQPFTVEDLSLAGLGLTLNTPESQEFTALPLVRTGLGDVAGVLTPVGLAMPGDIPDVGLEGRVALAKRGIITFQSKAENVFAAGAVGLVVYNNVAGMFQGVLASQPDYPVISLSREDGEAIEALLAGPELAGSNIEASIVLTLEDRPSRNVIAEKTGAGDAVVVLGGHYDTVPGITGANDNASGTAVLLAIAESLAGDDLPFTLRIVPFGSEELGLLGSQHYVQSLSDEELDQTKAMFNFDALGSGTGVSVFGDRDFTELATALGAEIGVDITATRGFSTGSSDHATFQAAGVPFLMFYSDDFSRIHTEHDTTEFVRPELLSGAAAAAVAVLRSEEFAELINSE